MFIRQTDRIVSYSRLQLSAVGGSPAQTCCLFLGGGTKTKKKNEQQTMICLGK